MKSNRVPERKCEGMKSATDRFKNIHGPEDRVDQHMPERGELVYRGLIIASFLYYLWLACQIPYTHDDWDWGIQIGLQHLVSADINSRYAGNFIVVILTRSVFLKNLVMGLVFTLTPVLTTELVLYACRQGQAKDSSVKICLFSVASIILLGLPTDVWRQTYGWVAGFSNYVVSGFLLLVFLLLVLRQWNAEQKGNSVISSICAALFGVVIQLFLENLSVFFLLMTAVLTVLFERKKKGSCVMRALLLGTILGFLIAFSSDVFKTLWKTGYAVDEDRELMYDRSKPFYVFIVRSVLRFAGAFVPQILGANGLLASSASLLLGLCVRKKMGGEVHGQRKRIQAVLLCALDLAFSVYYGVRALRGGSAEMGVIPAFIDCVFACLVLLELYLLFRSDKKMLFLLSAAWLMPFVIIVPMVAVNTVGPRIYYTAYLCLILFCQLLLTFILRDRAALSKGAAAAGILLILAFGLHTGIVYDSIGRVNRQRIEIMQQGAEAQSKSISLPAYPYPQYLWFPNPAYDEREAYFREFYHLPDDMALYFEK